MRGWKGESSEGRPTAEGLQVDKVGGDLDQVINKISIAVCGAGVCVIFFLDEVPESVWLWLLQIQDGVAGVPELRAHLLPQIVPDV